MSSERVEYMGEVEEDDFEEENFESESFSQGRLKKSKNRGEVRKNKKGRPKGCTKNIHKKRNQDEEDWSENGKQKERGAYPRQESSLQGYIKIIDYLKKIQYDGATTQNKMNPYNALTATCFWYSVSAEYFSYNFFSKKNPNDACNEILDKVQKLPLQLANRIPKIASTRNHLPFETQELSQLGIELADKLDYLIPSPLSTRPEIFQKKIPFSTPAEDDEFISSTRAIVYNYISKKIKSSQKWLNVIQPNFKKVLELPTKLFARKEPMPLLQQNQEFEDGSQLDLLKSSLKKKIVHKQKKSNLTPILEDNVYHSENQDIKDKAPAQLNGLQNQNKIQQNEADQPKVQSDLQNKKENSPSQNKIQIQFEQFYEKHYGDQDLLLDGILHMPIDKVISILQSSLPSIKFPVFEPSFMPIPESDPLQFVYQLHPDEEKYLEYMKAYQRKAYREKNKRTQTAIEEEEREGQYEDAKCQICTDGDYTEDNLIVFCSMCNISLHQRCVGLAKVPAQSWVCQVCQAFGPAGINLPCPLCNVKGGAMKRTNIHIDTNLFRQTNPGYYQFSKKCPYSKVKEEYMPPDQQMKSQNKGGDNYYYDYFVKSTYPNDVPSCHYVWTHYVCAIWVPQCFFQQKNGQISIKGIQNIQRKRFRYECFVCKKTRSGASVKCEDSECDKFYHPQCARKKKVYMEQLNLQKLKYLIFCEEHEPLKITRQIQYKKKKAREQIVKFARMIQKYIETYRIALFPYKLLKNAAPSPFLQTVVRKDHEEDNGDRKQKLYSKASDEQFLKELMINLAKANMMTVQLEPVENGFKIVEVIQPSKRQIRKCLNRYDQFWNSIKNGDSNEDNFKRYERIIIQNNKLRQKLEDFLNGNMSIKQKLEKKEKKVGRKRGKHAILQQQTLMEEEGGIFCLCRKPYQGQTDMCECEICGEWYHFKCLGFIGSEADAQKMEFKCMKCMKFEAEDIKIQRLKKYEHLFSQNSPFYNYRPPTPELLSQDENEYNQYHEMIESIKKESIERLTPKKSQENNEGKQNPSANSIQQEAKQEEETGRKTQNLFISNGELKLTK